MSEQIFAGQTAIITGAGHGLGEQYAKLLAWLGASVVVNDIAPTADDVVDAISADGGRAVASRHDVSDYQQMQELVATALDAFGGLQIVISNAVTAVVVPFEETDPAAFDRIMKVNVYGYYNLLHVAWPHLLEQRYGRVVLVSSPSVFAGFRNVSAYATSKGADLGLAMSLAAEGEDHGITVNVLAPGAATHADALPDTPMANYHKKTMQPALVAPAVAWLCRKENALNGEIIEAIGGRVAYNFFASTRGYWNEDLTLDDLIANTDQIFDQEGFRIVDNDKTSMSWAAENWGWGEAPPGWALSARRGFSE